MKQILPMCLLLGCCIAAWSQETDAEKLLEPADESNEQPFLLEYLEQLQYAPMDINQASSREWQTLPWITPALAQRIVAFRKEHGPFQTLSQLRLVEGVDAETYKQLRPYLACRSSIPAPSPVVNSRVRMSRPLQHSRGFSENRFAGNNDKTCLRLQSRFTPYLQAGLLLEKDSGERSRLDYVSWYSAFHWRKPELLLLAGRYAVSAGEGLVFGRNTGYAAVSPYWYESKNRDRPVQPDLSADENSGLNGVALSMQRSPVTILVMYHNALLDASLEEGQIRSFPNSGLHRTSGEREDKDAARQQLCGAMVRYQPADRFSLTWAAYHNRIDPAVVRQQRSDNLFSFQGRRNSAMGWSWDLYQPFGNLFGEVALSDSSWAGTIGLWHGLQQWQWITTLYYAPASFHNTVHPHLYQPEVNLQQWNIGLGRTLHQSGRFSFMLQIQRHPWVRYHLTYAGTVQRQILFWAEWQPYRSILLSCRLKQNLSPVSQSMETSKRVLDYYLNSIYLQTDVDVSKKLSLRSRLEWNRRHDQQLAGSTKADSQGMALYQQIRIHAPAWCKITARLTWFNNPCYDNRVYLYEPDVPGIMRIKMLYGQGWRRIILLALTPLRGLQLSAKYEETLYSDRNRIGSGWDEIRGNRERLFTVQLDQRW